MTSAEAIASLVARYAAGGPIQTDHPDVIALVAAHTTRPMFNGYAAVVTPHGTLAFSGEVDDGNCYHWVLYLQTGILLRKLIATPARGKPPAPLRDERFGEPPPMRDGCHIPANMNRGADIALGISVGSIGAIALGLLLRACS